MSRKQFKKKEKEIAATRRTNHFEKVLVYIYIKLSQNNN